MLFKVNYQHLNVPVQSELRFRSNTLCMLWEFLICDPLTLLHSHTSLPRRNERELLITTQQLCNRGQYTTQQFWQSRCPGCVYAGVYASINGVFFDTVCIRFCCARYEKRGFQTMNMKTRVRKERKTVQRGIVLPAYFYSFVSLIQ